MINWIILDIVLLVVGIMLFKYGNDDFWNTGLKSYLLLMFGVIIMCTSLCTIIITIISPFTASNQIVVFEQQQEYIKNHEPADTIENAAITNKKIELNEWLYNAQWRKDKFGSWSFYPDEIFELQPIQ